MQNKSFQRLLLFILLCSAVIFSYWPVLISSTLIDIDINWLVESLLSHHSLKDYLQAMIQGTTVDIQPVRDFFLFLIIKLNSYWPFHTGLLLTFNVLLWLGCSFLVWKLFDKICKSKTISYLGTLLFSLHPVFSQSIPWQSANKHILSLFFILICILTFYSYTLDKILTTKRILIICISYFLSIFSQPITILVPCWFIVYAFLFLNRTTIKRREITTILILVFTMLLGLLINYLYFSGPYLQMSGVPKFYDVGMAERLLAIGRYFFQQIVPYFYARYYYEGTIWNLLGLLLLPIFFYVIGKIIGKKETILWGTLWLIPLFLMNAKPTVIFVSDTYLLLSTVAFFALITLMCETISEQSIFKKKFVLIFLVLIIPFFSLKTQAEAKLWTTPLDYLRIGYEREKSCKNIIEFSKYLWRLPEMRSEAIAVTKEVVLRQCFLLGKASVAIAEARNAIAASIYFSNELTIQEKGNLLRDSAKKTPYAYLFLAAFLLEHDQFPEAEKIILFVLNKSDVFFQSPGTDPAFMEIEKKCLRYDKNKCRDIILAINKIKQASNTPKLFVPEASKDPAHPDIK